jgi:malate dehydrogenase (oxaloacetate-decarboxylating)(NADP+)
MIQSMAKDPIVFALANPDPEISYPEAKEARADVIIATGRSDFPNQVNNVLGFPFIFRGALDVRAKAINEPMKMAAARALAALAKEEVPESVTRAYAGERFTFGRDYIIPKPLDPRVLLWVAPAVAQAAMESGVARQQIDLAEYRERLSKMQSLARTVMSPILTKAKKKLARIVFVEGHHPRIHHAAQILKDEGICEPILLVLEPEETIRAAMRAEHLDLDDVAVVSPLTSELRPKYTDRLWELRQRKGMTREEALLRTRQRAWFGSMMVREGQADGLIAGLTTPYADAIAAPLQVIGTRAGRRAAGVYVVVTKDKSLFFADCTVHLDPTADELADIAIATADLARRFDVTPRVAMVSYSTFGGGQGESPKKMRKATEIVRQTRPELEIEGEIQIEYAMSSETRQAEFPFSQLKDDPNVLVFPNLDAANMAYQLLHRVGGAEVIGPVLLGMQKPVNILQLGASVQSIVNLTAVTALRAHGDEFLF